MRRVWDREVALADGRVRVVERRTLATFGGVVFASLTPAVVVLVKPDGSEERVVL